jgi:hypothetical protein
MADFNITIGSDSTYKVTKTNETSTECATIYKYNVEALAGESITVTLIGDYDNATYTLNGVTSPLVSPQVIVFDTSLTFSFSIENSGNPGVFYSCDVNVVNGTTSETIDTFSFTVERDNDGTKCASGTLTYDELGDTPNSKVGQAGKYIVVSEDELTHEYVDIIGNDKSFEFTQNTPATVWSINHNLSKFPSVSIVSSSGDEVEGNIKHTDNNNTIITFSASFSGKAYLN